MRLAGNSACSARLRSLAVAIAMNSSSETSCPVSALRPGFRKCLRSMRQPLRSEMIAIGEAAQAMAKRGFIADTHAAAVRARRSAESCPCRNRANIARGIPTKALRVLGPDLRKNKEFGYLCDSEKKAKRLWSRNQPSASSYDEITDALVPSVLSRRQV